MNPVTAEALRSAIPGAELEAGDVAAPSRPPSGPVLRRAEALPDPSLPHPVHVALLGTGTVGRAVLERLEDWTRSGFASHLEVVCVANTRTVWRRPGLCARGIAAGSPGAPTPRIRLGEQAGAVVQQAHGMDARGARPPLAWTAGSPVLRSLSRVPLPAREEFEQLMRNPFAGGVAPPAHATRILIDATPCAAIADRHADWLARGIHVVTACKLARGTSLARWRAIEQARIGSQAHYGDAATVGAGLPILHSLRGLQAGGDRIHSLAGVLSGSLAWLFHHYDGMRPFSALVRQAREAGYTEPDPREDLSGEDVRRKLLILARAAGVALEADDVVVESLVPSGLSALPVDDVDRGLEPLDAPLREHFAQAWKAGEVLRFVARLERGKARVGLESLAVDDPLAGGVGTDNRVVLRSDRYDAQPLVIQGPGAGAGVTAAALLDDVLRIASAAQSQHASRAG